jgi:hypothetical protein
MNSRAFLRSVAALAIIAAFTVFTFADTIRLKDGSTIKGRITGFSGGKFIVAVGEGSRRREFTFTAGEIESIEFDRNDAMDRNAGYPSVKPSSDPIVDEKPLIIQPTKTEPRIVPANTASSDRSAIKPIVISINVLADNTANGWTNSGWVVKKGQKIRITGDGEVSLGKGQKSGPGGQYALEDSRKLLSSVPTGALIAVIGDDNNDFIYIGTDREFVATRDGTLFLGLNEGNLDDNSGSFKVKVEISPES